MALTFLILMAILILSSTTSKTAANARRASADEQIKSMVSGSSLTYKALRVSNQATKLLKLAIATYSFLQSLSPYSITSHTSVPGVETA